LELQGARLRPTHELPEKTGIGRVVPNQGQKFLAKRVLSQAPLLAPPNRLPKSYTVKVWQVRYQYLSNCTPEEENSQWPGRAQRRPSDQYGGEKLTFINRKVYTPGNPAKEKDEKMLLGGAWLALW